ncbi:MAG: coenzyme hydrogenase subunit beta, partial [Thermoproteota archaeon]|nr:coenzyme hydrogenase subunit beta [Thermoproteota archaeon]
MSVKVGFEDLKKNVVERGICAGCGACVVVCPYKRVLEYFDGKPKLVGECKVCGICSRVCPRYAAQTDELEKLVFGRTRKPKEDFGVYREIHVVKRIDNEVQERCQDGGVATALINSALDSGMIDAAIVSGVDPSAPWLLIPFVAVDGSEVIHCAGTRYTYSPNL